MSILTRSLYSLFFLAFFYCSIPVAQANADVASKPFAIFTLIKNADDQKSFAATIELKNIAMLAANNKTMELAFNSIRPILTIDRATLIPLAQGGDFYLSKFT